MKEEKVDRALGIILWSGSIDRSAENPKLRLEVTRHFYQGNFKNYKRESAITLPMEYGHLFYFHEAFRDSKYGKLPDLYKCLRHYSDALLKEQAYGEFLELIEQFPDPEISIRDDARALYQLCDTYCSRKQEFNVKITGCLLAIIGVTKTRWQGLAESYAILLADVNEEFVTHLTLCKYQKFVLAVKKGLICCMEWHQQRENCLCKLLYFFSSEALNYSAIFWRICMKLRKST